METEPACSFCTGSAQVQHFFLSIRGIEVHPSTTADDDSPDWQELLPAELVKQPLQVDLVRGTTALASRKPLGEIIAIPAGIYRQVRLRFVPNQSGTEDRLPEKNACGSVGFNCVVIADGRIQPLLLDRSSPELRIMPDRIEGGSLLISPETDTDLLIELKPVWALFSSAGEGVRLLPALTGSAKVGRVDFDELGTPAAGNFILNKIERQAGPIFSSGRARFPQMPPGLSASRAALAAASAQARRLPRRPILGRSRELSEIGLGRQAAQSGRWVRRDGRVIVLEL
jgi:hypothetical protein